MSYLLDALNKSGGDENRLTNTPPQPVMYQQAPFTADEGVNVYKEQLLAQSIILESKKVWTFSLIVFPIFSTTPLLIVSALAFLPLM